MALSALAVFVVTGIFCCGLSHLVADAEYAVVTIQSPPRIDPLAASTYVSVRLKEMLDEFNRDKQLYGSKMGKDYRRDQKEMKFIASYQKYATEDVIEAQERRVELETKLNTKNESATPLDRAQLKFEVENAIASESRKKIGLLSREIVINYFQKTLKDQRALRWTDNETLMNDTSNYHVNMNIKIENYIRAVADERKILKEAEKAAQQTRRDIESMKNGRETTNRNNRYKPNTRTKYYGYGTPGFLLGLKTRSLLQALERTTKAFKRDGKGLTTEELYHFLRNNETELLSHLRTFCPLITKAPTKAPTDE